VVHKPDHPNSATPLTQNMYGANRPRRVHGATNCGWCDATGMCLRKEVAPVWLRSKADAFDLPKDVPEDWNFTVSRQMRHTSRSSAHGKCERGLVRFVSASAAGGARDSKRESPVHIKYRRVDGTCSRTASHTGPLICGLERRSNPPSTCEECQAMGPRARRELGWTTRVMMPSGKHDALGTR
jgi:hypothetical protein